MNLDEIVDPSKFAALDLERFGGNRNDLRPGTTQPWQPSRMNNPPVTAQSPCNLLTNSPKDGPSLLLLRRAIDGMIEGHDEGHPDWDVPGK